MNAGNATGDERMHGQTGHKSAGRGPLEAAPATLSRTVLLRHIAVFAVANTIFWLVGLAVGAEGLRWAYMITLGWGVVLIVQVVAFLAGGQDLRDRKYARNFRDTGKRWGGM